MKILAILLAAMLCAAGGGVAGAADAVKPVWPDVMPNLGMYSTTYSKPKLSEDGKAYSQTVRYEWTGGRFEQIDITLVRDPAVKERYSAENLKKEKQVPSESEINKKKAFAWQFDVDATKFDSLAHRLVVVLDADKALIIEQRGAGLELEAVAKKFDFDKVIKALDTPPAKEKK